MSSPSRSADAPDVPAALHVKACLVRIMMAQVYRGDYDNPRLRPDRDGAYHYRDGKIRIACRPSAREGWHNCEVSAWVVRRRFPPRRLEPVLVTGFGREVHTFHPGPWVDDVMGGDGKQKSGVRI